MHPLDGPIGRRSRARPAVLAIAATTGGLACAIAFGQSEPGVAAAPAPALPEVIVTGNPLGSGLFEMVQPASVLSGQALNARRAGTLGETLSAEPGISATEFGPNASRPVIRGLDGDRIRIMQNGTGSIDASSLSFDHATTIDPLVAERIEVVRGPGALLYGGSAIGGVVNVIDNRIPTAPITGVGGRAELRGASADSERSGVAVVEAGNGQVAIHADGYKRTTDDVAIPGFARSARQRAIDALRNPTLVQPYGRLPNTFSQSEGGALGGSLTWDKGYAGLSLGSFRSTYGTPADETVKLDMRKDTIDLGGEARGLGTFVDTIKFRLNHTDYEHSEKDKDSGDIHTTFKHKGYEGRLEAQHAAIGPLKGAFGVQFGRLDFSALGDEAFVPQTRSNSNALFLFEELPRENWKLNFGARAESTRIDSEGDQSAPGLNRFGAPQSRSFSTASFSFGGLYNLDRQWSLAANIAYTERAPTTYELFANGPHGATGTYEVGSPDFKKERSTSIDLALRRRSGPDSMSLGVFQTKFQNYLLLTPSGRNRGEDGSLEDPATPGTTTTGLAAGLPEFVYQQVPALFQGLEAQGRWRLLDRGGTLDFEAKADYVRATNRDTDAPLPRIAPLRLGAGLVYQVSDWYARAEITRLASQTRVAPNELPTDGYTMVNAYASYRIKGGPVIWEVFLRGTNLLNVEARNHVSVLKDVAPLTGRNIMLGVRANF